MRSRGPVIKVVMPIGYVEVEVYQLCDGRRLIAKSAMSKALNISELLPP
jgi:hypothetical protein